MKPETSNVIAKQKHLISSILELVHAHVKLTCEKERVKRRPHKSNRNRMIPSPPLPPTHTKVHDEGAEAADTPRIALKCRGVHTIFAPAPIASTQPPPTPKRRAAAGLLRFLMPNATVSVTVGPHGQGVRAPVKEVTCKKVEDYSEFLICHGCDVATRLVCV